MWKAAGRMAAPLWKQHRRKRSGSSEEMWDSSVSGTFTEHLCSIQLTTRTRGLELRREVKARGKDLEA